jgi:predicted metal-dependent hydrolase
LGRNHSLQIEVDGSLKKATTKMERGKLVVYSPSKDEAVIQKAIEKWYRERAKERINERIKYFSPMFDVQPTRVQIKDQQKRWGSCTPKGELLFNWKCVMAPANVLDYIVVHEMCHLVHRNHSKSYWQLLKRVMPDYEVRKQWLKQHGVKYDL